MGAEGKFYAIAISQALGLVSQLNVVTELFPIPDHLVSNGFQNSGLARVDAGDANHAQAVVLFDHLPPVGGVAEQGSTGRRARSTPRASTEGEGLKNTTRRAELMPPHASKDGTGEYSRKSQKKIEGTKQAHHALDRRDALRQGPAAGWWASTPQPP